MWFSKRLPVAAPHSPRRRPYRPAVGSLEARLVPTMTFHGGSVIPHVKVQALYLGSDWSSSARLYQQTGQLEGFCQYVVHSRYMTMLGSMGYGVGRGSWSQGAIDPLVIDKGYYLEDSAIQGRIQDAISAGDLRSPDASRLYVVFVEGGVSLIDGAGDSSDGAQGDSGGYFGYHNQFDGGDAYGRGVAIHYAVVTYPGAGNPYDRHLHGAQRVVGTMTSTASHEIAEAATDPDGDGWFDARGNEVGDVADDDALLGGYVVQALVNKRERECIPPGARWLSHEYFGAAPYDSPFSGDARDHRHGQPAPFDHTVSDAVFAAGPGLAMK